MIEADNKFRESVKDFIFEVFKGFLTTHCVSDKLKSSSFAI